MSALVDRIAAAVLAHCPGTYEEGHCDCGEPTAGDPEWAAHVAERIAEALQLTEETKPIIDPHWQDWCERILGYERRWVSEWTAVDPANQPEETS